MAAPLFTMMVLMALITTAMATPVLDRIYPARIFLTETGSPRPDDRTAARR
ncbi:hypothetical protein [Nocardia thailandica]|uniref:Uncharacterized protein n=1 Tax=Nocardia thailandica TaxID=257275 RepID=A0ABW6PVJ5_9NOCA